MDMNDCEIMEVTDSWVRLPYEEIVGWEVEQLKQ